MSAHPKSNTTGILLALGGGITLSMNDLAIKELSGSYALHQVILIRAFIGMALVLGVMALFLLYLFFYFITNSLIF